MELPSIGTFVEWPSEEESGIELELRTFTAGEAEEFLAKHPEVRDSNTSEDEAVKTLQERVLSNLFMQWRIEPSEKPVAHCLIVPEELRHQQG